MRRTKIAIYGAGGFAREVAWLAQSARPKGKRWQVVCFVDDNECSHGTVLNGIPIMSFEDAMDRFSDARVVAAIASPSARQAVVERVVLAGFQFETIIHDRTEMSEWIEIGNGTIICAGSKLTTNILLGNHVQINLDCTIGHDVVMGDYTTLAPGVHVSGGVHFGKRAFVGAGAVIINGTEGSPLVIGDDAVIGLGACVTRSVPSGSTVFGVPARQIERVRA